MAISTSDGAVEVLIVDLNNFARYPTMAVGYLASILRRAGHHVSVFAPLMVGVRGVDREVSSSWFDLLVAKINHRIATSGQASIRRWRDRVAARRRSGIRRAHEQVVKAACARIDASRPRVVLISTYLMYREVCEELCAYCHSKGIPVVIGGAYFAQDDVISSWSSIHGLTALVAGEVELKLPQVVDDVVAGRELSQHVGVFSAVDGGGMVGTIAPPLGDLDQVPFPDYQDFPWGAYPNRIVSIVTGRGCGWGVCTFCSDIVSTAGRTFRSRSVDNVLAELAYHHKTNGVTRFVFADLKLNSNVSMWRAIAHDIQRVAPGSTWIGAVHVGPETDAGLSESDLAAAASSGCVRLTTGLETGSQRVADWMKKGTQVERTGRFLRMASDAGISTRCTMIIGHPGELASDVEASVEFLRAYRLSIERVALNRLQVIAGTVMHRALRRQAFPFQSVVNVSEDHASALVDHGTDCYRTPGHRKQVGHLLTEVHRINSKPLQPRARDFEGVM